MNDMTLEQEIMSEVHKLDAEYKRRVLEYARSLITPRGISGKEFIARTGNISISLSDLEAMQLAIEEDCEGIEEDE